MNASTLSTLKWVKENNVKKVGCFSKVYKNLANDKDLISKSVYVAEGNYFSHYSKIELEDMQLEFRNSGNGNYIVFNY